VIVETETGKMEVTVAIVDIRPGTLAMYYPEANALVPRRVDARSRTPAFKSIAARVRAVSNARVGSGTEAHGRGREPRSPTPVGAIAHLPPTRECPERRTPNTIGPMEVLR
jgi:hypothetical protein